MLFSPQFSPLRGGPNPGFTVLCPGEDSLPSSPSLRNLPTQDRGATSLLRPQVSWLPPSEHRLLGQPHSPASGAQRCRRLWVVRVLSENYPAHSPGGLDAACRGRPYPLQELI